MSISRAFSPEELQKAALWQLPDIGLLPRLEARVEDDEMEHPPAITAEAIEAIQKQAYDEALEQGRQDGYREGRQKGYDEGSQKGYEEGSQKGYQEGLEAGEAGLRDVQRELGESLRQLLASLDKPLAELDEQVERELVLLSVAIAKQVVRRELKIDPGQIVATVKSAVGALPSATRDIMLHLHPEDAELVKSALSLVDSGAQWKIVDDPLITRGGCRVTSEFSVVDATVEKRLAQAVAKVLGDDRESSA